MALFRDGPRHVISAAYYLGVHPQPLFVAAVISSNKQNLTFGLHCSAFPNYSRR
jgi:hypothetical protein